MAHRRRRSLHQRQLHTFCARPSLQQPEAWQERCPPGLRQAESVDEEGMLQEGKREDMHEGQH